MSNDGWRYMDQENWLIISTIMLVRIGSVPERSPIDSLFLIELFWIIARKL